VQIAARDDAGDTLRLRGRLGTDTANGYYRPFEDALLDDLVTVHTGTDQFDIDDQNFPVAAITINLRQGGDWDVWYDLGSAYTTTSSRQFQVQPVPAHNHPPNLCQPGTPGSTTRLYLTNDPDPITVGPAFDAGWDETTASSFALATSPSTSVNGGTFFTTGDTNDDVLLYRGVIELTADMATTLAAGGATLEAHIRARARHGIGVDEGAQQHISQMGVRVTQGDSTTIRGTALALHSLTSVADGTNWPAQATYVNRIFPPSGQTNVLSAVPGAAAGDFLLVEIGYRTFNDAGTPHGGGIYVMDGSASDLPDDEVTTTNLNSWIEFVSSDSGGDLPFDTVHQGSESVGTSNRAARCDHEHAHGLLAADGLHYHDASHIDGLATDPPVIDGFVLTTLGGQHDLSTVAASGSAETLDLADGNVHDVTLTDDCTFTFTGGTSGVECRFRLLMRQDGTGSHVPTFPVSVVWPNDTEPTWSTDPDAVDIIEFTSVDGGTTWFGDAGGSSGGADPTLRWEAVTNGEDVFVWEGDDLVHEWKAY
jgi:hypothetical protein